MGTILNLFKWKHYETEIILLTVRWYLKYSLSYHDVAEMMKERELNNSHTTIMQRYAFSRRRYHRHIINCRE